MIYLVSPDCVLYVIIDTHPDGPDVQQLRQLRSDMPPPKNFNQLSGWTTGQRAQKSRAAKGAKAQEVVYPAKQKWALDPEVDVDTRRVCEAS